MEEKVKKETIDAKLEELNKLRVTLDTVIPEQKALVNVNGQTVFGRGDLVAVKAKAKQGKTTMLKHMVAAMLKGELPPLNCEVEGCRVLWCDTEQKMSDVKKIIYDIVQISGLSPGFIASHLKLYTFRKLTYQMMVDNTEYLIKSYHPDTVIIDTSTAHRTEPGWAYGFPELSPEHREAITKSRRIAVPGCYASGFIGLAYPLVKGGILPKDYPISIFAISGYSGGGKKLIADYEAEGRDKKFDSARTYGWGQTHKHLKEMKAITGIDRLPLFSPLTTRR